MAENKELQDVLMSIIIVNYNSGEMLRNCVDSLLESLDVNFEVIIYDNFSQDASLACLDSLIAGHPGISIIRGASNLGFAKANNLAAEHASGRFLHFLNPDIVVDRDLNTDYMKIASSAESSIWVTGLTDASGNLQKNKHLVALFGNLLKFILGNTNVAYWNIGASVIIHKDAFHKMGGWPEDYFMYAEDLDFFYTAYKRKIKVNYLRSAVIHIGKGVTHKIWNDLQRATIIERSFRSFYRKYRADWEYIMIRPIQLFYMLFNEPATFPLYAKVFLTNLFKK